ncbi:MAG: hypothetical protein R6V83_02310 [Candidatus Thorarchaeota archaeon]
MFVERAKLQQLGACSYIGSDIPSKSDKIAKRLGRRSQPESLVSGCPCYKEFGDERVCLNNDDVVQINPISVATSFFPSIDSFENLQDLKSDKDNVCYLLVYLDEDKDKAYCVSQGKKLVINGNDVRADDLRDALRFVNLGRKSTDGEICSTCMYKYLITLGDVFEDVLSEDERTEIIADYIEDIANRMAQDMTGGDLEGQETADQEEFIQMRITQLMEQRADWEELIRKKRSEGADEKQIRLLDNYRRLNRLEATFLSQVHTMIGTEITTLALNALRMMIAVAKETTETCNRIRSLTHTLTDSRKMPADFDHLLEPHAERRRKIEHRFDRVERVLSEIEIQQHR